MLLGSTKHSIFFKIKNRIYLISIESILPRVQMNGVLLYEIQNYLFNDYYAEYTGGIKSNSDFNRRMVSLSNIDNENKDIPILIKPRSKESNKVNLNTGEMENKNNNFLLEALQNLYLKMKSFKKGRITPDKFLNLFMITKRNNTGNNANIINGKLYFTFPNLNLEIKRISTIKLSNNSMNKYLAKKSDNMQFSKGPASLSYGYLGMSKEYRIVALTNDEESSQQIVFGIWLNFPDENMKKNPNEEMLEIFLQNNRLIIYEKCLHFILKSAKINVINSASPDEGVFLLILFINGVPFNFEVKLLPNEKEKRFSNDYANEWLICSKKFNITKGKFDSIDIDINPTDHTVNKIESLSRYMMRKFNRNSKIIKTSSMTNDNNNRLKKSKMQQGFKDPLNELFEEDMILPENNTYFNYDFPLAQKMPQNHKHNILSNNSRPSSKLFNNNTPIKSFNTIETDTVGMNSKMNRYTHSISDKFMDNYENKESPLHLRNGLNLNTKNLVENKEYGLQNLINDDSETLTISSSKGASVKSYNTNTIPNKQSYTDPHSSKHKKFQSMNEMNYFGLNNNNTNKDQQFKQPISSISNGKMMTNNNETVFSKSNSQPFYQPVAKPFKHPGFEDNNSNMNNAYEIIFDQAKSIKLLQDKVMSLQSELENVVSKLKITQENSLTCSCGRRSNQDNKPQVISTGTDTSLDFIPQNNSNSYHQNESIHRSVKSFTGKCKASIRDEKNEEKPEYDNQQAYNNDHMYNKYNNNMKYEDKIDDKDERFDNFLNENENSINLIARQFLDIDNTKQYESNYIKDDIHNNSGILKGNNINNIFTSVNLSNNNLFEHKLNINLNDINNINTTNFDLTNTSVDPPSYRYVLKVPSMIRSNTSVVINDERQQSNRLNYLNNSRNDYTIQIPNIIFNESIENESLDETDL